MPASLSHAHDGGFTDDGPLHALHHPPHSQSAMSSWSPLSPAPPLNLSLQHAFSFNDDYDDMSDLVHLPMSASGISLGPSNEKAVRRRSSKACDQCRKSKCKCERTSPDEPCKSCVMLNTACTFLGPSRKRGPPKGYIDAIEARLHQTEALLGIMLASNDDRARTLLRDIAQDPLAKEIIDRVDNSAYGVKGRKISQDADKSPKNRHVSVSAGQYTKEQRMSAIATMHPSVEWQDQVSAMLRKTSNMSSEPISLPAPSTSETQSQRARDILPAIVTANPNPSLTAIYSAASESDGESESPKRRQRRKIQDDQLVSLSNGPTTVSALHETDKPRGRYAKAPPYSSLSPIVNSSSSNELFVLKGRKGKERSSSIGDIVSSGSESDSDFAGAMGQLSLNEDEEVRYHGKVSGLHLLSEKDRLDQRNEGGIWRFPRAGVWPPLPSGIAVSRQLDELARSKLPSIAIQERLLNLYFGYVHPSFPIIQKRTFLEAFSTSLRESNSPSNSDLEMNGTLVDTSPASRSRRSRQAPPLLLFAMFAIAARYAEDASDSPPPVDGSHMWAAGDQYLEHAKIILDGSYVSSRPTTCQALLLMGYREVGIGAMAHAWTYIGMAVRMAQDLGMHRRADGWARAGLGGRLFGDPELNARRRIWYGCVVMDKYVSAYIGRPIAIFERDFDTLLPSEEDPEEHEFWDSHNSSSIMRTPGHVITCFNATAMLSSLLGTMLQAIYSVRTISSRHDEAVILEGLLDKWYINLPEYLQYDPGVKGILHLPHVLILHMQYWCTVLLLHRPFIRVMEPELGKSKLTDTPEEAAAKVRAEKSYELSVGAANHITTIGMMYMEHHPMKHCPVFLSYYIFSAGVMHVISLSAFPDDPQARSGMNNCMELLKQMAIVWPSAGRALELLQGANVHSKNNGSMDLPSSRLVRHKRSAERSLDDTVTRSRAPNTHEFILPGASSIYPGNPIYNQDDVLQPSPGSSQSAAIQHWSDNLPGGLSTSLLYPYYSTGFAETNVNDGGDDYAGSDHRYSHHWKQTPSSGVPPVAHYTTHPLEHPSADGSRSQLFLSSHSASNYGPF